MSLASGAWIQVADETGRLAQQYNATKLEPLPGSQLSMREPRAMIYLKDGRVLTLASRKGVAYVPRRALESGTLEEDVEVRLFKPKGDGTSIDTDRDVPAVVVTAEQAQFDGILGEVRCDRAVRVVTDADEFEADQIVVTLPLGVLKAGAVRFVPELPAAKREAIVAVLGTFAVVIARSVSTTLQRTFCGRVTFSASSP